MTPTEERMGNDHAQSTQCPPHGFLFRIQSKRGLSQEEGEGRLQPVNRTLSLMILSGCLEKIGFRGKKGCCGGRCIKGVKSFRAVCGEDPLQS